MAEDLTFTSGLNLSAKYEELLHQISALVVGETDLIANLANLSAALKEAMGFLWVGFYLVKGDQLVLGPFQGPVACTRIKCGVGVCGTAWREKQTLIVPDVNAFQGHIACSSLAKSEIVLPVFSDGEVVMVLDVDSQQLNDFSETDGKYLQQIVDLVEDLYNYGDEI